MSSQLPSGFAERITLVARLVFLRRRLYKHVEIPFAAFEPIFAIQPSL